MSDALASRIRRARVEAQLSRESLAGSIGVSLATLVRYETGRTRNISIEKLVAIAEATGKPVAWFLEPDDVAA